MLECAMALAHHNHYYILYQREQYSITLTLFRTASNHFKRVLENGKSIYGQAVQAKVENKKLGSLQFWKIVNAILNRGKPSVPSIINGPEVISSLPDKAKLLAMNFAANTMLDDKDHSLPNFPHLKLIKCLNYESYWFGQNPCSSQEPWPRTVSNLGEAV